MYKGCLANGLRNKSMPVRILSCCLYYVMVMPLAGPKEPLRGGDWGWSHYRRHGLRGHEPCRVPGQEYDCHP